MGSYNLAFSSMFCHIHVYNPREMNEKKKTESNVGTGGINSVKTAGLNSNSRFSQTVLKLKSCFHELLA